jgi:hypothetical protein
VLGFDRSCSCRISCFRHLLGLEYNLKAVKIKVKLHFSFGTFLFGNFLL